MKIKELGIWIGIIVATLAILWGMITLVNNSSPDSADRTDTPAPVSKNDITLGATESAKVTIIEYADFQCPACKTITAFLKQAAVDFKGQVLIVYRFFPLVNIHKNSISSSQAAFAAYKQNKFWEMDELLYGNQDSWTNSDNAQQIFEGYAKNLNLNIDQFTKDYSSDSTKKFITDEQNEGFSINISYTPSVFVNGQLIVNPQDYAAFKQIVQNAINNK